MLARVVAGAQDAVGALREEAGMRSTPPVRMRVDVGALWLRALVWHWLVEDWGVLDPAEGRWNPSAVADAVKGVAGAKEGSKKKRKARTTAQVAVGRRRQSRKRRRVQRFGEEEAGGEEGEEGARA